APDVDDGSGVQILHLSPFGPEQDAIQIAAVFDRPMVPITGIDDMNASIPVACSPELPAKARWAGTSTAVIVPDGGRFPRATHVACSIAAGTAAVDGVTLEKTVTWTFDTPRPRVVSTVPRADEPRFDPKDPIELVFDQPVDPKEVASHLSLDAGGTAVALTASAGSSPNRVTLTATLSPATAYQLALTEGVTGLEGPLPSTTPLALSFSTYPALTVTGTSPTETSTPNAHLELNFSTNVAQSEVAKHLQIQPEPDGWEPPEGEWEWDTYHYGVVLAPNTRYTVTLTAGLSDVYGQTLAAPTTWEFKTGDYVPWLTVPENLRLYASNNPPALPFKHLNATRVDAVAATFDPSTFDVRNWQTLAKAAVEAPGATKFPVEIDPEPNRTETDTIDLGMLLGKGGTGWVATRFSAPNVVDWNDRVVESTGLVVVTDLGGTLKVGPGGTELWVTSLAKGTPVEGVQVELFVGPDAAGTATTDANGLAHVDGIPGEGWSRWQAPVWAVLTKGGDRSLVTTDWDQYFAPWGFRIYGGYGFTAREVIGHGFADRGVYRLGDPVYARATFRLQTKNGLERSRGEVSWSLSDPDGAVVANGDGSLDDRGGFSVQTALPAEGALGDWTLSVLVAGDDWRGATSIPVPARAYRPPAFRVEVAGPGVATAGQEIRAVADARYLFGAPMTAGSVHWRAWTVETTFAPDGYEDWSFGPEFRWWDDEQTPQESTLGEKVEPLADGRSTFAQPIQSGYRQVPIELNLEAEVTDVDRQAIANRATTLVHPAAFYVGLRPKVRLPKLGEAVPVEVIAVNPDGTPHPADVEVEVVRRDWNTIREKGMDGQWRWVNTPVDEVVTTQALSTGKSPAEASFTSKKSGYHVVKVTAKDALGNRPIAEYGVYVLGAGFIGWGRTDDNHMDLVPEHQIWHPGDTARILVKAPAENLRALVTVEREGVLWKQVTTLTGTGAVIEVPITAAYAPNVFVSVVAVQGAGPQDAPDKGRPEVFAGLTTLRIDTADQRLAVEVKPTAEVYRPRDEVEVQVAVSRAGKPLANAGVTLYAVDQAVLSLTAYATPDAFDTFYADHGLSVVTADGRVVAIDRAAYLAKGANRGGGGGMADSGPELRSKFVTTVTWQPDLKTGPDGTVTAKFTLPDNLTTFRVMAVADAGDTSFGSADAEIRVSRPLIVRPALPRLLRTDDLAYAGVVVHNGVDQERWVHVTAEVAGPIELSGAPVDVKVPAGGAVEVPFALRGLEAGEAKLTFSATSGDDRDAVEWPLPVRRDLLLDTVASAGVVDSQPVTERIARPDGAYDAYGGLTVDVATTALVGAGSGLAYLQGYPHECLEQRTSRGLGDLTALLIRDRAGITLSAEVLRADLDQVLGSLGQFRVSGGGLGYWSGADEPSTVATAYAVELLARSKEAAIPVDTGLLDASVSYLREAATGQRRADWDGWQDPQAELVAKAYVASSLARAGHGDAGLNNEVFARRKELSVFGIASLLEAIARTGGPDARTAELGRLIAGRSFVEAASASVKENEASRWSRLWGSDDLSTAAALEALTRVGSADPLLPKYALHLASSRVGDRWANTRATASVLSALAAYAQKFEAAPGGAGVPATVTVAGRSALDQAIAVPGTWSTVVPMHDVANGDLVVSTGGGRLYYGVRLAYAPKDPVPRDEGFTIVRSLELVDGGADGKLVAGATLRATITVVTPVTRHDVAVVDRIPAGFEIVDTSLATASHAPTDVPTEELGYADADTIEDRTNPLPDYGGSWAFDHHELDDGEVRLYASYLPAGVHTYRYQVRATSPGTYTRPPATVEEMYEPENFGRTGGGTVTIGAAPRAR
ncbi:MAG: Ig-like domain-containing protein, partial [Myxococcota bacterium]